MKLMNVNSDCRLGRIAIIAFGAPFALLLGYGFVCGIVDATLEEGWLPAPFRWVAEVYRAPAVAAASIAFIGKSIEVGNYFGYDFAGGPETTR